MTAVHLHDAIDLPTIDLDAADDTAGTSHLGGHRRSFDERYAQLAFGLGTVPRRAQADDPWWETAPGVLGILAVVIGLLLLAS